MLRLTPFTIENPSNSLEVVALLNKYGSAAKLCAGGTDLLPNLKHELYAPQVVINLAKVHELKQIEQTADYLFIGAGVSIEEVSNNAIVAELCPGLASAARAIAGPQLRRMGTIGGNICLDTRCLYYNQTHFWREALGFCLKKDGTVCHVTQTGKRCVAATSNDLVTMLTCLEATVFIVNQNGQRMVEMSNFYRGDGQNHTVLEEGDLLSKVRIPIETNPDLRRFEGFAKLRHRESIDYPLLSVGVCFWADSDLLIKKALLCINALAAKPRLFDANFIVGKKLEHASFTELAAYAQSKCHPLTNICDDPAWRKEMVGVYALKACLNSIEKIEH